MKKSIPSIHQKKMSPPKQPPQKSKPHFQRRDKVKKQKPLKLYAMRVPRHMSLALSAFLVIEKTRKFTVLYAVILQSASSSSKPLTTLEVTINGVMGTACAETATIQLQVKPLIIS
ncbi:hypothetical protein TNCV_3876061 [Trichonephila clavipes]|uniref:Uncharacterized protein n=1 Tax=Trichonephila clavipes TaxID=2585209 RepID=A0A8X6T587_TRICX|nr:hypothetical protein TNCV_3876061 [Trichonephila clavipes]